MTSPLNLKREYQQFNVKAGLSIDTTFYPPKFSLDSTFEGGKEGSETGGHGGGKEGVKWEVMGKVKRREGDRKADIEE